MTQMIKRMLKNPYIHFYICLTAIIFSVLYSSFVYPKIKGPLDNKVETDGYNLLALSIYHNGIFAYYPNKSPTVMRGPVYPAFVAGLSAVSENYYPYNVQLAQAILHGLTCLLVFYISRMLWGRITGFAASLICALHPYLIWYTSRVVIETLSTFLFTAIIFFLLYFIQKRTFRRAVLLGFIIGISTLCKQTYLPFIVIIPVLLFICGTYKNKFRYSMSIVVIAALVILPWTVRNYNLTGKLVVVHALSGYNFHVGDFFIKHYTESPLGYAKLVERLNYPVGKNGETITHNWLQSTNAKDGLEEDQRLTAIALSGYMDNPMFFLRKLGINVIMFWTMSSTPFTTLITTLMQVPLLIIFVFSAFVIMKKHGAFSGICIPIWLVFSYFFLHLPIFALARFGTVLIPTMIAYAVLPLYHRFKGNQVIMI